MKLYFVRHGKTLGNIQGRYVGRTDEPLLQKSMEELRIILSPDVDLVAVSPLMRCLQSADCLYPAAEQRIFPDLREMDFGEFEYKNYKELNGNPDYQAYIDSGGALDFPGAEPAVQFKKRCRDAFMEAVTWAKEKGASSMAFVVHGGTIMAIMEAYGLPGRDYFQWQIKNGESIEGELDDRGNIHTGNRRLDGSE